MEEVLAVATPERVSISLPIAGIGYRTLAYLVDFALMLAVWIVLYFAATLVTSDPWGVFTGFSSVLQVTIVVGVFALQWVYWTACEALWNGQTLGKRALKIRVVREDGSPVGVLEAAVRNLCRVVDFFPLAYGVGVVCMLLNARHRRVGDFLAGTVLIRDERIDLGKYGPSGEARTGHALATSDVEMILGYLERAKSLAPDARQKLAAAMVDRFGTTVSEQERAQLKASVEAAEAFLERRARA